MVRPVRSIWREHARRARHYAFHLKLASGGANGGGTPAAGVIHGPARCVKRPVA
jgi:hypothetical protein